MEGEEGGRVEQGLGGVLLGQPAMLMPELTLVKLLKRTGFVKSSSGLSKIERPTGIFVRRGRGRAAAPLYVICDMQKGNEHITQSALISGF